MKEIGESRSCRTQGSVFRLVPENSSPRSSASYHPAATVNGTPVTEFGKSGQNNTKRSANSEIFYKEILEISLKHLQVFFLKPDVLTTQQRNIVTAV